MSRRCLSPHYPESATRKRSRQDYIGVIHRGLRQGYVFASGSDPSKKSAPRIAPPNFDPGTDTASAAPFDPAPAVAAKAETETPKILIVDDEQTVRRVCTFALRGEGWAAESDGSASRALARLQTGERFDALVLDFAMPEMDGLEFLRGLRALPARQQPAVLMASAHADGSVALAAFRLGVWDLLSKPLLPEDIRRKMRRLLARRKAAAGGDLRAQSLLCANQAHWAEARKALAGGMAPLDELLRGLFFQLEGEKDKCRECFSRANWWDTWDQQGPEIWAELSKRLDAGL